MSIFADHQVTRRSLLLSTCCLIPGIRLLKALDVPAMTGRDYTVKPVPLTQVDILDDFLGAAHGSESQCFDMALLQEDGGVRRFWQSQTD